MEGLAGATVAVENVLLNKVLTEGVNGIIAISKEGQGVAVNAVKCEFEVNANIEVLQLEVLSANDFLVYFVVRSLV